MADKLYFQIIYGEGEILHSDSGVDLSNFQSVTLGISRPTERTFEGLQKWLLWVVGLKPEEHVMRVRAVVSRAMKGYYWELLPITSTKNWRDYVKIAIERNFPLALFAEAEINHHAGSSGGDGNETMDATVKEVVDHAEVTGHANVIEKDERVPSKGRQAGAPAVAVDASPSWHADLRPRFDGIVHRVGLPRDSSISEMYNPPNSWLLQSTHNLMWECQADAKAAIYRLENGIQMTMEELLASFHRISAKAGQVVCLTSGRTLPDVAQTRPRPLSQAPQRPFSAPGVRAPRTSHRSSGSSSQGTTLQTVWRPQLYQATTSSHWPPRQSFWPPHVNQAGLSSHGPPPQTAWQPQPVATTALNGTDCDSLEVGEPDDLDDPHFDVDLNVLGHSQGTGASPPQTQLSQERYVRPQPQADGQGRGRRRGLQADGAVHGIRPKRGRE